MRYGPSDEVLSGAAGWSCRVSSWLGDTLLSDDVPVTSGRVTAEASSQVPERLSLTVPGYSVVDNDRYAWCPRDDPRHPLARYGQQLAVQILVTSSVTGQVWDVQVGRFLIQSWDEGDDGSVQVEAVGILQVVADDRLITPTSPHSGGTLWSEFNRLLPDRLAVVVSPQLTNRACPQAMEWSEDRLGALYDIADAWPARLRSDPSGLLRLLPALDDEPPTQGVLTLVDGERGTVVSAPRSDTRDRIYNRVVARSTDADDPDTEQIQAVADQTTGPMATTSEYGVVTRFYASPLIATAAQALATARTILASSIIPSRSIPVSLAPDPRIELDDAVTVQAGEETWTGYVVTYDLPLTVTDGGMQVTVGIGLREDDEGDG